MNLLIVDDEPMILRGLHLMISEGNTPFDRIEVASNGEEALRKMSVFPPDLILTDIEMPGMNGLDFIHQARKLCKRIVILTGYDRFEYAQKAIRFQVRDYLLKPINEYELLQKLASISLEILQEKKTIQKNEPSLASLGPESEGTHNSPTMRRLFEYLSENYTNEITLESAAAYMKMNPNYLSTLVKRETGKTFIHHVQSYRIEQAKKLIEHTDYTMDQIAQIVHFNSPRHFFNVFKHFTGLTPGQFREKSRNQV